MSSLPDFDCSKLSGRMKSICDGTSGLPEFGPGNTREAYLKLWANEPPAQVVEPDFSCIHRGPELRTEQCKLCGGRDFAASVHSCTIYGECTVHAHGLKNEAGKLSVCVACESRTPNCPS